MAASIFMLCLMKQWIFISSKAQREQYLRSHNDIIAPSQITDLSRILNLLKNIEDDTSEQNQGLRNF